MATTLLQVSLIVDDPGAMIGFYTELFDAPEEHTVNPDGYRGVIVGGGLIGLNEPAVRGKLGLEGAHQTADRPDHDTGYFTVSVDSDAEVDRLTDKAVSLGATKIAGPLTTPFGWYLTVVRDPAGNAFRLACARGEPLRQRN